MAELKRWLRFSPNAALRSGDGLFSAAGVQPALPEWLGPWLFERVFTVKAETDRWARQIASSAGIAVFASAEADPAHWVQVGRACQRCALQATALGLTCAFLNQPVEVPGFRADLAALVGLRGGDDLRDQPWHSQPQPAWQGSRLGWPLAQASLQNSRAPLRKGLCSCTVQ